MEQNKIEVIRSTPFPQALFKFRDYDGAKFLVAIIFVLSCVYFGDGILTLFNWTNKWWRPDLILRVSYFCYHMFLFTIVYCFTWLVFDKRAIQGYALTVFSTILGIIYIFSPIDVIPEIIPVVGSMDDAIVGSGSIILGVGSWFKNKRRRELSNEVAQLLGEKKYEEVLERLLRNEGYNVKRLDIRGTSSDS